jgi:hypothetical protein
VTSHQLALINSLSISCDHFRVRYAGNVAR